MIDFANASYLKLTSWDAERAHDALREILVPDEIVRVAFKGARDSVTFTNRRIIAVNVQGVTGRKKDYTSLPYAKIQAFSVETAETFDLESELVLWISGLGCIRLEFSRGVDVRELSRVIGEHAL
jgi:hypothetical protein